jgi:hypothetical protein
VQSKILVDNSCAAPYTHPGYHPTQLSTFQEHNSSKENTKNNRLQDEMGEYELRENAQTGKAELPQRFGSFSIIALAFVMTNSWCAYTSMYKVESGLEIPIE